MRLQDVSETVEREDQAGRAEPFDAYNFRRALGAFPTGVTIVTTRDEAGKPVGMTANSFSSVSLDPPLVLWCIMKSSISYETFMQAATFAINVLGEDQQKISNRFARPGEDKFASMKFDNGLGGAPLFPGCAAQFECLMHNQFDGGDHMILVGEVKAFRRWDRPSLVFTGGRYRALSRDEKPMSDSEDWPISFF